jgi:integrase
MTMEARGIVIMAKQPSKGKPYPDFPLFRHASGQWAKKVRGKMHYFGIEWKEALAAWDRDKDALYAGRTRKTADSLTVRDLCNRFLTTKKLLMESGELSPRTWRDYHDTCGRLVAELKPGRAVADLAGDDFERLRAKLAKTRGPVSLGNEVQRIRTIAKYAFDEGLIDKPIRFGSSFKKPSRKSMRAAKRKAPTKLIEAADVRTLIEAAGVPLKAMILLAVNAGYGQSDLAGLPLDAVDLKRGWTTYPRPKTEMERRAKLWPETIKAVGEAVAERPSPKDRADAGLVFITKYGHRWVRSRARDKKTAVPIDAITLEFNKLLDQLGLKRKGVGFYSLRHSFRTAADGAGDQRAVDYVMGHVPQHISGDYVERIEDERLEAISAHVHKWVQASQPR